jgi:hypothetical protein
MVLSCVNTHERQSTNLETLETSYDQRQELEIQILTMWAYETYQETWVGVGLMKKWLL